MAEDKIKRKDLWKQISSIDKEDWIKAAKNLKLNITQPKGGSSHYAIRLPGYEKWDMKGLICVVYDPIRKDTNEIVFKKFLNKGYKEDDIWKALKMLE